MQSRKFLDALDAGELVGGVTHLETSPQPRLADPLAKSHNFVGGQLVRWENGVPVPVIGAAMTKHQITQLLAVAATTPFRGDPDPLNPGEFLPIPLEFMRDDGTPMSNGEVALIRLARRAASGDDKATTELLDRLLGKPKQQTENLNMSMTLEEYLDSLPGVQ